MGGEEEESVIPTHLGLELNYPTRSIRAQTLSLFIYQKQSASDSPCMTSLVGKSPSRWTMRETPERTRYGLTERDWRAGAVFLPPAGGKRCSDKAADASKIRSIDLVVAHSFPLVVVGKQATERELMKSSMICLVAFEALLFSGSGSAFGQAGRPQDTHLTALNWGTSGPRHGLLFKADLPNGGRLVPIQPVQVTSPHGRGQSTAVPSDYPTIQSGHRLGPSRTTPCWLPTECMVRNISVQGQIDRRCQCVRDDGDTSHSLSERSSTAATRRFLTADRSSFVNGEDTNAVLCGFTIRGGTGTRRVSPSGWMTRGGGGILIYGSSAKLIYNTISGNTVTRISSTIGGGVEGVAVSGCRS